MSTIITLTSDFGLSDGYVAALKGIILNTNPDVDIVDISHNIKPQNISQTAFVLMTTCHLFPPNTIHLVVVDPEVGTKRRAIIVKTPISVFVAPDNGVLSYVIKDYSLGRISQNRTRLKPELEVINISNARYWRTPVSNTFHGRDILAPITAYLSLGYPITKFGKPVKSMITISIPQIQNKANGIIGKIIYIDNFGNLVTNITAKELKQETRLVINVNDHVIKTLGRTYVDHKGLLALIGSSGYLEISFSNGNAQEFTGANIGDTVNIIYSNTTPVP
jgi:S-adenosylmethionine hydrolase